MRFQKGFCPHCSVHRAPPYDKMYTAQWKLRATIKETFDLSVLMPTTSCTLFWLFFIRTRERYKVHTSIVNLFLLIMKNVVEKGVNLDFWFEGDLGSKAYEIFYPSFLKISNIGERNKKNTIKYTFTLGPKFKY